MTKLTDFTISAVSRESLTPAATIRSWADKGWLKCRRDSSGRRIFDALAVAEAKRLREARSA